MNPPENLRPYRVYAIEDGTVIDHIPGGKALKVIEILGLNDYDNIVTVGMRLDSNRLGKKDIIKIEHRELTKNELDKIAIIAPHASINIIKEFKKVNKFIVELPKDMVNIVKCSNPNCISHHERHMKTHYVQSDGLFACYYCETVAKPEELELL